jgi:hypothetical protein
MMLQTENRRQKAAREDDLNAPSTDSQQLNGALIRSWLNHIAAWLMEWNPEAATPPIIKTLGGWPLWLIKSIYIKIIQTSPCGTIILDRVIKFG